MGKIVVAGHICLDITPVFNSDKSIANVSDVLIPGKLVNMRDVSVHTGGCVANTGLALKLLGNDVKLMGKIGKDEFGSTVKQIAKQYGVDGLIEDDSTSTSYSVVLAIPGLDRIFLHNPGANDTFTYNDIDYESLKGTELFHFGYPTLMKQFFLNNGEELLKVFKTVHDMGILTSLDLSSVDPDSEAGKADWKTILSKVLPYVDYFEPSYDEICYMLGRKEPQEIAKELVDMGCKNALVKCGEDGLVLCTSNGKVYRQGCFKPDCVLSATGAGDTCIAAYLTAVLRGYSVEKCLEFAAAEGACCVTSYDALGGLKSIEELEKKIENGWERADVS